MPGTATHTRGKSIQRRLASRAAKTDAFALLKADHQDVSELFKKAGSNRISDERKQELVRKICKALTVHAQIEEEIFYPAAKEVLGEDDDMLGEAEVEHGSIKGLIAALEGGSLKDKLYGANLTVLEEYVKHHVKEEQNEMFPKLRKAGLDGAEVGARLAARKTELMSAMN